VTFTLKYHRNCLAFLKLENKINGKYIDYA
jgi:hypothetical protein